MASLIIAKAFGILSDYLKPFTCMLSDYLERFITWMTDLPALPTALDSGTCAKKGLCPISSNCNSKKSRRNVYYEIHGDLQGSQKLVLIMGMNFTCSAWSEQVEFFSKKPDHAVLVFDNPGSGNSGAGAVINYKSSDMAKDTLALLNWLGWDQERSLHLVGVSLGGMVAQELCLMIPQRFKSVTFLSTRCGSKFDNPSKKAWNVVLKNVTQHLPEIQKLDIVLDCLFPREDMEGKTADGRSRREIYREKLRNCHILPRRQNVFAFLGHFYAAHMHYCSFDRLRRIAIDLGPAKILVMTGDSDEIILPKRSIELHENLPGSELIVIKNAGHALTYQISGELNAILERTMNEGSTLCASPFESKMRLRHNKTVVD